MKALFCVDHYFIRDARGDVYSPGQFPYGLWQRYLEVFDSLTIVGRCRPLGEGESIARLNRADGPMVSFKFLSSLASVAGLTPQRRSNAARIMTAAVAEADAVIARLPSENGLLAARLALGLGKPLAVEAVACAWDQLWNYGSLQGRVYAPVQMWRMRRAIRMAPYTIYVSRFMEQRYPGRGMSAVIPDVDLPPPPEAVLERRLEHIRTHRRRLVFGLIGSIQHKYKGVHTALEALARVRDRLPGFELRVLGPGDPRPWQARAQHCGLADHVRFCGILPAGPPVFAWLDEIDLYLQPSFQESLGRALIEAMGRACPALGSTTGGIPDLLAPECLHEPGDAVRLADLLLRAAHDTGWLAAQAERNFALAREYARDRLDGRRSAFWQSFARHAAAQQANASV